jgi:hypothetical protein
VFPRCPKGRGSAPRPHKRSAAPSTSLGAGPLHSVTGFRRSWMNRRTPYAPASAGDSQPPAGRLRSHARKNLPGSRAVHRRDQEHTRRPQHPRLDCMACANPLRQWRKLGQSLPAYHFWSQPQGRSTCLCCLGLDTGREGGLLDTKCA